MRAMMLSIPSSLSGADSFSSVVLVLTYLGAWEPGHVGTTYSYVC